MMGTLQKCLLGVVDDAGCKPYGCGKNADRIRVENSYPAQLPQPLFDRGPIARGIFFMKTRQLESDFVFQAVLAASLGGVRAGGRGFQHYVRS